MMAFLCNESRMIDVGLRGNRQSVHDVINSAPVSFFSSLGMNQARILCDPNVEEMRLKCFQDFQYEHQRCPHQA